MPPVLPLRYAATTRALHWITALMILAMLPIGVLMLQEDLSRTTRNTLFILHKNGGVILLVLVTLRILWRFARPAPALPPAIPLWQQKAARAVQIALYGLLLVMALSGYVRVRAGGFPIEMLDSLGLPPLVPRSDTLAQAAKTVHANARFPLAALIVLHIGAGLRHAVARDGVFGHIWPPIGK